MPSDRLFGPSQTTPEMAAAVSDNAWLAAMLEVEAAIAEAEAEAGLVPVAAARAIRSAAGGEFDVAAIGRQAATSANPVVPLVAALTAAVPASDRQWVHFGATSQDVLDTAMMLVARRALDLLLADLEGLSEACAALARRHRQTLMPGRTLLQQAVPITFGLKAAGWLAGVSAAAERLGEIRRDRLALQFGGAAGTLASLGPRGLEVASGLARRLELAQPPLPWHAERTRVAELGAALAVAAAAAGKVALDLLLLTQTEVGEVAEAAPGGSSAMPHKRNPVAAIVADACARGAAAQAAVLLGAMRAEHERAAGAWQAEWPALSECFLLTAGAVSRTRTALEGLRVDEHRMRANLDFDGGVGMAEAAVHALRPKLGQEGALAAVRAAVDRASASGRWFRDELAGDAAVTAALAPEELERALEPAEHLGSASAFIDRALAHHTKGRRRG